MNWILHLHRPAEPAHPAIEPESEAGLVVALLHDCEMAIAAYGGITQGDCLEKLTEILDPPAAEPVPDDKSGIH